MQIVPLSVIGVQYHSVYSLYQEAKAIGAMPPGDSVAQGMRDDPACFPQLALS